MVNRGGFSFVAMLVINPIVILFYQNCSMTPISHAQNNPPASIRQIASDSQPIAVSFKPGCVEGKQACLKAE
jgi:hypothetical protein